MVEYQPRKASSLLFLNDPFSLFQVRDVLQPSATRYYGEWKFKLPVIGIRTAIDV